MSALPTLRQLQYLVALAEHRSFSRAAESVHVTQSTLSAGIKELETILGAPVVDRTRRGVRLTPLGDQVLGRGTEILQRARALLELAQTARDPLCGDFRLGVIPTIAPFLLPALLPGLKSRYPALRLFLREDLTQHLAESVRRASLTAALLALPADLPGLEWAELAPDPFLFASLPDHPLAHAGGVGLDDLPERDLLLLEEGHCLRDHVLDVCRVANLAGREMFGATSLHTVVHMVNHGLGVTLLPRIAVDAGITAGTDVVTTPFADPIPGRTLGLAWRRGTSRSQDIDALLAFFHAAFRPAGADIHGSGAEGR